MARVLARDFQNREPADDREIELRAPTGKDEKTLVWSFWS